MAKVNFIKLLLVIFFMAISIFFCLAIVSAEHFVDSDIHFSIKTKKEISGYSKAFGTHFHSKDTDKNIFETKIFINNKQIHVGVGYGERTGEIYILGENVNTKDIINITTDEADILNRNLQSLLKGETGFDNLEENLARTLNLLSSWPATLPVIVDPDKITIPDECNLTYPDGISVNICPKINGLQEGRYATEGEHCGWAKYYGVPVLKLDEPTAWRENVDHLVGGDKCFGRCGKLCIGDGEPNNTVNIYTQDCFDHDLCAENEGTLDAECNWMFISAIDDFFYGPICPALDLIFVIDTTGSMVDDIANVKASATTIVNAIDSRISDYRVAVADYRDFPIEPYGGSGDYPYNAVLPFSTDKDSIIDGIHSISLGWGADWEESVYSALIRAIYTEDLGSWRNGVKKAVVLMGDAPPHDPEPFTGYTSSSVVLAAESVDPAIIYPIVIGGDQTTYDYFSVLAEETSGELFTALTADDVVDAILEAIEAVTGRSPRQLLELAIDTIQDYLNRQIGEVIEHIQNSLNDIFWQDESNLNEDGKHVFDEAFNAGRKLMEILQRRNLDDGMRSSVSDALHLLVSAAELLARTAVDKAMATRADDKAMAMAQKEMAIAQIKYDKGEYDAAMDYYKKSWLRAQNVLNRYPD